MKGFYFRISPGAQVALDSNNEVRRGRLLEGEYGVDVREKV